MTTHLSQQRLRSLLHSFPSYRILVVGDCMLDEYLWGRVSRISPEAPVPVVEHHETTFAAGGASNVAVNLSALGGGVSIVSVIGADAMGERLRTELERQGVEASGLVVHPERPTTVKTRIIAHSHQMLRVDREERSPLQERDSSAVLDQVRKALLDPGVGAVLLSDYSKGVLTEAVVRSIILEATRLGRPCFANPKPSSLRYYEGVTLLSVNQSEAETATGQDLSDLSQADAVGSALLELCRAEAVMVTLGGRGLMLFEAGQPGRHVPVISLEVYDPAGCGDSAIAAAALARLAGANWLEAAMLANLAGSAKVRKLGVVPVHRKEIENVWAIGQAIGNGSNGNGGHGNGALGGRHE